MPKDSKEVHKLRCVDRARTRFVSLIAKLGGEPSLRLSKLPPEVIAIIIDKQGDMILCDVCQRGVCACEPRSQTPYTSPQYTYGKNLVNFACGPCTWFMSEYEEEQATVIDTICSFYPVEVEKRMRVAHHINKMIRARLKRDAARRKQMRVSKRPYDFKEFAKGLRLYKPEQLLKPGEELGDALEFICPNRGSF